MTDTRIFVTADIGRQALDRLRKRGWAVEVHELESPPPYSLLLDRVRGGVSALVTTLRDKIDETLLISGEGTLRIVAQVAVGVDNIDREAANRHRIPFSNTADVLTEATAEFAFFMLGAISRRLDSSERLVRENVWRGWHPMLPFLGDEATGKTIGIVGAGRIGKALARKCIGLDMDILLYSPRTRDESFIDFANREMRLRFDAGFSRGLRRARYDSLDRLLESSDYISLHVPLVRSEEPGQSTHHLIDDSALRRMKKTAYLINTSRGAVIDENALAAALRRGEIAGAALDVFATEPLPADNPLRDPSLRDRLRLFHHFASGTRETRLSPDPEVGMAGRAVQAVIDVLENRYGGNPADMPYIVNKEAFRKDR